jgi:hypothetical protein
MPRKYILIIVFATASVTALAQGCLRGNFTALFDVQCAVSRLLSLSRMHGLGRKNVEQARVAALHVLLMCLKLANEKGRNRFHFAIYSRLYLPSILVEVPDGF